MLLAHFTTILFIAWGPLTRDPIFRAAAEDLGDRYLRRMFTTYFMIATLSMLFVVAIFENELMRIAGPKFADGARLIPLIATGSVLYGVFRITYVGSDAKHKVGYFQVLPVISLVVYVTMAIFVAPHAGVYGPPIARGAAYGVGWAGFMIFIAASHSSSPFDWRRVLAATVLGGAILVAERLIVAEVHGALAARGRAARRRCVRGADHGDEDCSPGTPAGTADHPAPRGPEPSRPVARLRRAYGGRPGDPLAAVRAHPGPSLPGTDGRTPRDIGAAG